MIQQSYDDWIMEMNKKIIRERQLNEPELYNKIICKWQIDFKGQLGIEVIQDHFTGDSFSDIKMGYGSVEFKGTKHSFDRLLSLLSSQDHSEYKIIGSHLVEELGVDHDQVMKDYLNSKE